MQNRDKQILALRTAFVAGIFSLIICTLMLLNYWQLVTTDPLESEALQTLVEKYLNDTSNEDLKIEIRNIDLIARNAYFNNQWQIRSGSYLLIGGIVILVISLRVYYASKAKVLEPEEKEASLDIELFISRKWILYTVSLIFILALVASFLSIDHLSETYAFEGSTVSKEEIPVQQIITREDDEEPGESADESDVLPGEDSMTLNESKVLTEAETEVPAQPVEENVDTRKASSLDSNKFPGIDAINNNFPSFRGPLGLGVAHQKNTPTSWNGKEGTNILWKAAIPLYGNNSPVIWGNSLFLTGADENTESVYCYNASTGKLLWERNVPAVQRPQGKVDPNNDTGFAAPTAATDGRYVFAIFATGDLICIDRDGKDIWAKNIGIPDNHYGHSSSLLVWKDMLFIQFDTNETGKVFALDVHSGNLIWETMRTSKISWASPVLADLGDHYELILSSSPEVAAYDPDSGRELWKLGCLSGEVGPSPAFSQGVVFVANEYASLVAIKSGKPPVKLWESNEYLPEVSSPVASGGLLFLGTSYGVIGCFDVNTGDLLWEYESNQGFYASPIINEDKVYFLDRGGKAYIFSLSKTLNLINDPELGERTVSTPAFAEGRIYIRGEENLYCIGSR